MTSNVETALRSLVQVVGLVSRPTPDPNTLGDFVSDVSCITRDDDNLFMQPQGHGENDGGDSANRTGVLAFCGSKLDQDNLPKYIVSTGTMTRHPTQTVPHHWNDPNNCTRDQLIPFIAGCWRAGQLQTVKDLYAAHAARNFTCQDIQHDDPGTLKSPPIGDPLSPEDIMYFRICTGDATAALDVVGQLNQYIAIQVSSNAVDHELNQELVQAIVCGQLDVFLSAHPRYTDNLDYYWNHPSRLIKCIGDNLVKVVGVEITRYKTPPLLNYLIPQNVLQELESLKLEQAVKDFVSGNPLVFAELSAHFVVAILRDCRDRIEVLENVAVDLSGIQAEIVGAAIVALRSVAAKGFDQIGKWVNQLPAPVASVVGPMFSISAAVLGFGSTGSSADDAAEAAFRAQTTQSLAVLTADADQIIQSIKDLQTDLAKDLSDIFEKIDNAFYQNAVGELQGAISSANDTIDSYPDLTKTPEKAQDYRDHVEDLKTKVYAAASTYGPKTLPFIFHGYGVICSLLSKLPDTDGEIKVIRNDMRKHFEPLLYDPASGPVAKLALVEKQLADSLSGFQGQSQPVCIGVASWPVVEIGNILVGHGKPMPDSPTVLVRAGRYHVAIYMAQLAGSIEDTSSLTITASVVTRTDSPSPITNAADLATLDSTIKVFDAAAFLINDHVDPQRGSQAPTDTAITVTASGAFLAAGRARSDSYLKAHRARSETQAQVAAIKAALSIQLPEAGSAPAVAAVAAA